MSQIVTINSVKITNLDLAKEVAKNLGWNESKNQQVRGMGNSDANITFDMNSRYNMGLKANADGSYSIMVDSDARNDVIQKFVVNYTKQFVENEIKLQGKTYEVNETADEIIISYEA